MGVEIGSHGVNHEIHHENQPASVHAFELLASWQKIEERIGHSCREFVYPNGDFVTASPAELQSANYQFGFTLEKRFVTSVSDPYLLPRIGPPAALDKFIKRAFLSGFDAN